MYLVCFILVSHMFQADTHKVEMTITGLLNMLSKLRIECVLSQIIKGKSFSFIHQSLMYEMHTMLALGCVVINLMI